jgi:hypothetical protein
MKSRLNSGNTCSNCIQDLSSFPILFKNFNIKVQKTVILPVVLYGCETTSLTLREEHNIVRMFVNRVLRRMFGS